MDEIYAKDPSPLIDPRPSAIVHEECFESKYMNPNVKHLFEYYGQIEMVTEIDYDSDLK